MRPNGTSSGFAASAFALIVGVTEFEEKEYSKRPLPQSECDALDLATLLHNRLGWNRDHVHVLTGAVSKTKIFDGLNELEAAIRQAPDPTLFLMFLSTHGYVYQDPRDGRRTVLLAHNTELASALKLDETGMTGQWLGTKIAVIRAKQNVFIADACYSGAVFDATDVSPRDVFKGIEAAVISSSILKSYAPPGRRKRFYGGAA